MKISDEIRRWCNFYCDGPIYKGDFEELRAIADRIDKEMVKLPKYADGEPIHVGDTAYLKDGREVKVIRFIFEPETLTIVCSLDGNPDVVRLPFELWHERHDSWERISDDIETFGNEADINDTVVEFLCKIQERIRKLAAKEDQR